MPHPNSPRQYNPSKPGNAPRIPISTWELFQDRITTLHNEGHSKKRILKVLQGVGFEPSYPQLRLKMERWGLVTDTDEGTSTNPPTASPGAVEGEGEDGGDNISVTHCSVRDHVSETTLDGAPAKSLQAKCDTGLVFHLGSFGRQDDSTSIETADETAEAKQTSFSFGASEVEQRAVRTRQNPSLTGSLPRNSLEIYLTQRKEPPYDHPRHAISTPSEWQSFNDSHYEGQSSHVSATPPLTLAETASMDDGSITSRKFGDEVQADSAGQPSSSISRLDKTYLAFMSLSSTATRLAAQKYIAKRISCSLLSLWPDSVDLRTLSAPEVCEIQGVAATLAAGSFCEDAFDLFCVEYSYWQARTIRILVDKLYTSSATLMDNSLRCMVTAAINCARNSPGRGWQREFAYNALLSSQELLQASGFASTPDMVLIILYLAKMQTGPGRFETRHQKAAARFLAVSCIGEQFKVILPEIQCRERIFMATSWTSWKKRVNDDQPFNDQPFHILHMSIRCLELQLVDHEHLTDCEHLTAAMATILESCKRFVEKNRRTFNKAGAGPRKSAIWRFYCSCVFGIASFNPLVQGTEAKLQLPLCAHGGKLLWTDTLLALAVISEMLVRSAAKVTMRRVLFTQFGERLLHEIKLLTKDWATLGPAVAKMYLSRIEDMPTVREPQTQ